MQYLAIDPGLDGGICIIREVGKKTEFRLYDIPTITEKIGKKLRRRYDISTLISFFKDIPAGDSFAVLEKSLAMPGQSSTAMVSIGFGQGLYQGILASHYIPFELVHPKKWQKEFSISGDTKSQSFQVASRLFPTAELVTPRGRVLTGRSDSLLMSEYARRKYSKENF